MGAGYWRGCAEQTIRQVFAGLPPDVTLEERVKAVDAAYPFGPRAHHPYKMWLKARRRALMPYGYKPKSGLKSLPLLSPLERAEKKAGLK